MKPTGWDPRPAESGRRGRAFPDVADLHPEAASTRPFIERRSASGLDVSVVVPTYRRPAALRRCLAGLARQSLSPAETIVVGRSGDEATRLALEEWPHSPVLDVLVDKPGVLAAMEAGAAVASSDIIAFIDDDAVPRPEWLQQLARHFDDPEIGGVGGRDLIAGEDAPTGAALEVGTITRWGKLIGNHHLGGGAPREVLVLKAVGVAFRRQALALPRGLKGDGAQVHFEVGMSLSARRRGWRLVYDPSALVDHEVAPRFDADPRARPRAIAVRDAAYNLVSCLLAELPDLFWRRALYGLIVGDHDVPGVGRAVVALLRGERTVLRRFAPSVAGQVAALRCARRNRSDDAHAL
jgi:glycosyltransferase involved in cell wall biosynthesis